MRSVLKKVGIALMIFAVYMAISYGAFVPAFPMIVRHILATIQFCMLTAALLSLIIFAAVSTWKHRRLESVLLLGLSLFIGIFSIPTYLRMIHYFGAAAVQEMKHGNNQKRVEPVEPESTSSDITELANKQELDEFIAQTDKPVVIKVSATWCPPCQKLKPVYHDIAHEMHESIHFGEIDIDAFHDKDALSSIKSLPTVLYYKNGKEVSRTTGFQIAEQIKQQFKKNF